MTSISNPISFNEHMWVIEMRRSLKEEVEEDNEVPVNIFNVPKALMANKPDCYVPQEVALGPFHRLRPELYEMERYKLAAAKRAKNNLPEVNFESFVHQLTRHETRIRACYHRFLRCNGETLAWMMAIDACFLLDFLQVYAVRSGRAIKKSSSKMMTHLVDYAGTKSAHNAILRDMVMVENQIPLYVLRKLLEFQFSALDEADDMLLLMLVGFGEDLCPFPMTYLSDQIHVEEQAHLLDFLYHVIVPPRLKETSEVEVVIEPENEDDEPNENKERSSPESNYVQQLFLMIWDILSALAQSPIRLLKLPSFSNPVKLIMKFPWKNISNLPGFSIFYQNKNPENGNSNSNSNSNSNITKSPLMEEISIPSVSELCNSGLRFLPTNGSISSITFDPKTATLYLPTVSLDVNTEVTLRNLVAYESSNASGPLIITRYTELMNGIIDTEEDAKILRERGIILNRLKSDEEVANLWNGMSRSIRLTKVPFLDKVIEDVNKYHSGIWKVKAGKFMKRYVFGSWQLLIFLATISIFLLMILQSFCSVYNCPRTFQIPEDQ